MRRLLALLMLALVVPSVLSSALPRVGSEAPVMRAVTYDGKAVSKTSLKGSIVVLMFVAEWCPHCVKELPSLSEAWRKYGLEREGIIGIVMMVGSEESGALKFFRSANPPSNWKLVLEGDETARDFGISGVPTTIVIDRNWTVAGVFVGAQPADKVLAPAVRFFNMTGGTTSTEATGSHPSLWIPLVVAAVVVSAGLYYYARRSKLKR